MPFHLDFETYSACDIALGAYRYASDPSTRILFAAISKGDDPIHLWDSRAPEKSVEALALLFEMASSDDLIYAHNAQFEAAVCMYLFESTFNYPCPEIHRWRCTASMCRRAAIPFSLAGAAEFLNLKHKKMGAGKGLIKLFSMPTPRSNNTQTTVDGVKMSMDEAWQLFGEYCVRDVEVERDLHAKLKPFEMKGMTLEGFLLDMRMNALGIPVNPSALNKALALMADYNGVLEEQFATLTGLKPSQTAAVLAWLVERGYPEDNLQAETMERCLEQPGRMSAEATTALTIRSLMSFAATKKIPTMLEAACADWRVRGAFMWAGALRTHRWAGRIIQPQNFKRPTIKQTDLAYRMIANGCSYEQLEVLWGSPLEVVASCIRHFIQEPDHDILDADFANIEARITPWLCGQEDMLDEFRRGEDVYITTAASIFGCAEEDVTKDQRFVGKQATLACQFQVSWSKFQSMCADYGRDLSDEVCKLAVFKYRKKRGAIVAAWRLFSDAAVAAIKDPGTWHKAGKVSFIYGSWGAFKALTMRLPSGHMLFYPSAWLKKTVIEAEVIRENEEGELVTESISFTTDQINFWGPIPNSVKWGWNQTYGGKLVENATQAVGGDFMTHGMIKADERGYQIFATIHDQALAIYRPDHLQTREDFRKALCTLPDWASDFPLDASVDITPYYTKE